MPPHAARVTRKSSMMPSTMASGLVALRGIMSRGEPQGPAWKLRPRQHSLSQSAQALSRYYRKMSLVKQTGTSPDTLQDSGFLSQMGTVQRAFFKRPGCPQLSTRATSMAHFGLSALTNVPPGATEMGGGAKYPDTAKVSVSCEKVHRTDSSEPLQPLSKSACELTYPRRSSSGGLSPASSDLGLGKGAAMKRTPWYIAVIHDKEHCLLMLEEELRRFSRLEGQLQKKDQEILELQEKQEQLRKQLRCALLSRGRDSSPQPQTKDDSLEEEELEADLLKEEAPEAGGALDGVSKSTSVLGQEELEEENEVLELEEEEEEEQELQNIRKSLDRDSQAFQEELMGQLQELEGVMQEFQLELEVTRNKHSLATGAISTLLRQVEYQDSQLRKVNMDNENLEKELRERKHQLLAMSDKFSNIRDEKKQLEMLGQMEKGNLLLRQQVSALEQELASRDRTILELRAQVVALHGEAGVQRAQLQRYKQLQEELQARVEDVRRDGQQTRVALETTQARLEKLRNKVMASSTSLNKAAGSEITDDDILDALQILISEHFGQLKQKGTKAPPLSQSESMTKPKKMATK